MKLEEIEERLEEIEEILYSGNWGESCMCHLHPPCAWCVDGPGQDIDGELTKEQEQLMEALAKAKREAQATKRRTVDLWPDRWTRPELEAMMSREPPDINSRDDLELTPADIRRGPRGRF